MSHGIDPPSYREGDPLPECPHCHERSIGRDRCLNPECPSRALCEWCREAEAVVIILGETEDRLCLPCGGQAVRAILDGATP